MDPSWIETLRPRSSYDMYYRFAHHAFRKPAAVDVPEPARVIPPFVRDFPIDHAKEAVAHGKEGHADELVKHAETALEFAKMGGRGLELSEGIHHLKEAIEHGKAGHADVGIEHIETALKHFSEIN